MKKDRFLSLVKNYTALTSDEATELSVLQEDFPYSQIVHNLAARAAQDHNLGTREYLLHVSAIYTTDRAVLKSIMTASRGERIAGTDEVSPVAGTPVMNVVTEEAPPVPAQKKNTPAITPVAGTTDTLSGDALLTGVFENLKKLKSSQHIFEAELEAFEKESAKATKKSKKTIDTSDILIEEIKTSKKKVAPEGKQKEQIEIIENFIKTKPSIGKTKAAAVPASDDLAEKSLLYGDNIVSETLVEILLKQGKRDKAIEVLKKLIWKFPQKKAYFAARIEDLKN